MFRPKLNLNSINLSILTKRQSSTKLGSSSSSKSSEHRISIGPHQINYVKVGTGSRTAFLLPGALGSAWTDFKPQIDKLHLALPSHTIIAWDPPGYGKSSPPYRQFDLDSFQKDADFAHKLMQALGRRTYSVLGWSDGGITGFILAAAQTEAVEKLIVWGSNSYVLPDEMKIYESKTNLFYIIFVEITPFPRYTYDSNLFKMVSI